MDYQILIGGVQIFSGTLILTLAFIIVVVVLLALIAIYGIGALRRKLREDEVLKSEFLTIIAHKFRTPLTSIKWSSESMLTAEADPYKKQSLNDIKESNEKLIKLTGTLIELAESDNASAGIYAFEKVNICDFTRDVANGMKGMFHEKNIFFSVRCLSSDVSVKIDRARMEFVLQTLFENACNYTSPGRNVDITVGREKRRAIIAVTDHGMGVDPRDLPRIFKKFFRAENATSADTEGVGIGLYLAKSVLHRHKGAIDVASEGLGRGTTFRVTLPVVR